MFRRLYSSLPIAEAVKPRAPARGRSPRPVRLTKRIPIVAPTTPAAPVATHGRRLRRGQLARTDLVSTQPGPHAYTDFEPITLFPLQAGLHLGLTPAHMPFPLPLGTAGYTSPSNREEALFEKPAPPSVSSALEGSSAMTGVGEHLRVSRAFAHPALRHHLPQSVSGGSLSISGLGFDDVTSTIDAAAGKHARVAEEAWDATLARLGQRPALVEADPKIADALAGLNNLLARLEASSDASDIVVEMDSVKRKRKKKMNKHKYKKRRKETRAIRKRLGK
ncbi:hypothetical protein CcaverHIS002_0508240 [Cutaneotrichosporon cavernicola]|nr:hypothetical protein CcaverHIS002_0508240 [Cutaneotrichosporon cavernicola]